MKQYQALVKFNRQVSNRYWHMEIDRTTMNVDIQPGQFFHIRCADHFSPFLRRPFSIYQINKDTIEFLYLVKGLGTKAMTTIQEGDHIDLVGPLGNGFVIPDFAKSILLVARGVGVATLAAIAQEAFEKNVHVVAVLSARTRDDLLASEYLEGFGATVYRVTEEEGNSDVDHVRGLIEEEILKEHEIDTIYTCGSKRLSRLSQRIAKENNIYGEIALEEHMGCAMGACFACVCDIQEEEEMKSVRVCIEGPVFPLSKVVIE
ncbi:dihydroorotate dehydrogenase electron transfer subunit [Bacillaceae bacterium S4-13-58]